MKNMIEYPFCIFCKHAIKITKEDNGEGSIFSDEGKNEFFISGMCEHCYDNIMQIDEDMNDYSHEYSDE